MLPYLEVFCIILRTQLTHSLKTLNSKLQRRSPAAQAGTHSEAWLGVASLPVESDVLSSSVDQTITFLSTLKPKSRMDLLQ